MMVVVVDIGFGSINFEKLLNNKRGDIIVYCDSGSSSIIMQKIGF